LDGNLLDHAYGVHLIFCWVSFLWGLEAIGKTQFGSLILAAHALEWNIPALKQVVQLVIFDLEVSSSFFCF